MLTSARLFVIPLALLAAACGKDSTPAAEFSLAITPGAQTITLPAGASGTASYTVATAQVSGTAEPISLTVSGLPAGGTGGFNPVSVTTGESSTLTLTAGAGVAAGNTSFTVTGSGASGIHTATSSVGICIPGQVTLAVTQTDSYACHQGYQAKFVVTNGSCAPVTATEVILTGTTTQSQCTASGTSTYPLSPGVVIPASGVGTALNLTGGNYCCTSSPCPATFMCNETYAFQVNTSAGMLTAPSQMVSIDLSGCTGEVCP